MLRFRLVGLIAAILAGCSAQVGPVSTTLPTMTAQPGWHALENEGFQIWVPESFIGGTLKDIDAAIQKLGEIGPGYATAAKEIKQQNTAYVVFAVDSHSDDPASVTNMLVGRVSVPSSMSMKDYVDRLATNLTSAHSQYKVLSREYDQPGRYPTGRLVVQAVAGQSGDYRQVMYAIKNGGTVWQVVFTTPTAELQKREETFARIASSITAPDSASGAGGTGSPVGFLIGVGVVIAGLVAWLLYKPKARTQARSGKTKK